MLGLKRCVELNGDLLARAAEKVLAAATSNTEAGRPATILAVGGALVLAGLYQLSPLKSVCLGKCRSPMSFLLSSWRDGYVGSVRMGIEHAAFCLGCCWLLFLILFPLGMMNIAILPPPPPFSLPENQTAFGQVTPPGGGVALIVYGAVVVAIPDALPMTRDDSAAMEMPMGGEQMPPMPAH